MGNCANKPATKDGEAPAPEQKPEEVAVEARETITVGEVEIKEEVEKANVEETTPIEVATTSIDEEAAAVKEDEPEKVEAEVEKKTEEDKK